MAQYDQQQTTERRFEMPKYLLAIYSDETAFATATEEDIGRVMEAYWKFGDDVQSSGTFIAGEGLMPTTTAKTVSVADGKTTVTDGPFAETKEQLGGFYLLECADEAEAIDWAARIPGAQGGKIEVRPVMEYPER